MKIYDVCIVGGGPAGAALALELSRSGRSVVVAEAASEPKRKVCGEYLCPRGVALLDELGAVRALESSRPVRGMRLRSPSGITVNSDFPGGETGRALRRDRFDPALLALAEDAGTEVRRGFRVEELTDDGNTWTLRSFAGSIRARVLVGADGRQSFVSRKLGNELLPESRRVALHLYYEIHGETGAHGEMHILPGGEYVGLNPTGPGEWNLSLVCDAETVREAGGSRAALEEALSRSDELKNRFLPLPDAPVHATAPITHQVRAVAGHRWALVGDAAGFLDPLTGEGMYQALLSARLLAAALERAFASTLFRFEPFLAEYAKAHAKSFAAKRRLNRAFQLLIRCPRLCDWMGLFLGRRKSRADTFIGIVGNLIPPGPGIWKLIH